MSRDSRMSAAAIRSACEREAVDEFFQLLEITFEGSETLYFCNRPFEHMVDAQGFEVEDQFGTPIMGCYHKGRFYAFMPFTLPGAEQADGKAPSSELSVQGAAHIIIPYLREMRGKPRVSIVEVHSSDPAVEQGRIDNLVLGDPSGNQNDNCISATVSLAMLTDVAYPCDTYSPDRFPGQH